jgi:hypothetical protein
VVWADGQAFSTGRAGSPFDHLLAKEVLIFAPPRATPNPFLQALSESVVAIESGERASRCVAKDRACPRAPGQSQNVPVWYPRSLQISPRQATTYAHLQGFYTSPLAGSNRRPLLTIAAIGNWSQPTPTVLACMSRFCGEPICDRLPLLATTGLHKGSIVCCPSWIRDGAGRRSYWFRVDDSHPRNRGEKRTRLLHQSASRPGGLSMAAAFSVRCAYTKPPSWLRRVESLEL